MERSSRAYERRVFSAYGLLVFAGCTVIPSGNPAASASDDDTETSESAATAEPTMPSTSMSDPRSGGQPAGAAPGAEAPPPLQNTGGSSVAAAGVSGGAGSSMSSAAGPSALAGSSAAGAAGANASASGFGATCQTDAECASSQCVKGRCCGVRDCGPCERCGDDGQCQKIISAPDPYTCDVNAGMCDANGKCSLKNGVACYATTTTSACASGHCDKFCCAVACGMCSRCKSTGDACESVPFEDDIGSCFGAQSCSNGVCVDAVVDNVFLGLERTVTPGEELAQLFWPRVDGTLVEIRLDTSCRGLPIALRKADVATLMPGAETLFTLQPRPSKPDDFLVSYAVSPGLKITQAEGFAFVLQNTGTQSCATRNGAADSVGSTKLYTRNGATAAWTEVGGISLSYKVFASR